MQTLHTYKSHPNSLAGVRVCVYSVWSGGGRSINLHIDMSIYNLVSDSK